MPVEIYGEGEVAAHAPTHEDGGSDPIAGCDIPCGQSPTNFTPTSATIGGMVEGIDAKLGELGAQSVSVDDDGVLNAASGTEVGATFDLTVNKAGGDYVAERTNVTETSAPGSANKLREWRVGGTPRVSVMANGAVVAHTAGTDAAPGLRVDRGSGGAVGITNPGDSELGLVANNEKLILDNAGANPIIKPDADVTWDLGDATHRVRRAFVQTLVDPLIAAAADPVNRAVSFALSSLTAARTITVPDANVDLQYARAASTTVAGGAELATQAEADAGTDAGRVMTPATTANLAARAPVNLNNSGVGAYTISDSAITSATGFPIRTDLVIDQQDASADLMAYTVGTAAAGSVALVACRNGQSASFTGSGVTLVPMDTPGLAPTAAALAATGATDRALLLVWVLSTRVLVLGGDLA